MDFNRDGYSKSQKSSDKDAKTSKHSSRSVVPTLQTPQSTLGTERASSSDRRVSPLVPRSDDSAKKASASHPGEILKPNEDERMRQPASDFRVKSVMSDNTKESTTRSSRRCESSEITVAKSQEDDSSKSIKVEKVSCSNKLPGLPEISSQNSQRDAQLVEVKMEPETPRKSHPETTAAVPLPKPKKSAVTVKSFVEYILPCTLCSDLV